MSRGQEICREEMIREEELRDDKRCVERRRRDSVPVFLDRPGFFHLVSVWAGN